MLQKTYNVFSEKEHENAISVNKCSYSVILKFSLKNVQVNLNQVAAARLNPYPINSFLTMSKHSYLQPTSSYLYLFLPSTQNCFLYGHVVILFVVVVLMTSHKLELKHPSQMDKTRCKNPFMNRVITLQLSGGSIYEKADRCIYG